MRHSRVPIAALMIAIAFFGHPQSAAAGSVVRAELEGMPIPVAEINKYYCHDLAFPTITCFRDAGVLEMNVASAEVAGTLYVTVYSDSGYTGSYLHISQDYDGLWTVGWNDHVSSFVGRNGESGVFYTDWYEGGEPYRFCCNAEVSYLGAFDDAFSSVYRR